jgi:uncharacterized protein (DUF1800 family)
MIRFFLPRRIPPTLTVVSLLLLLSLPAPAAIDLNDNGVSDIWEILHPTAVMLDEDTDGDGVSNRQESIWGTDPLKADRRFFELVVVRSAGGGTVEISWPTFIGKVYQLESAEGFTPGSWEEDGDPVPGTGGVVTVARAAAGALKMYRLKVTDVDGDKDGVSDWEAMTIGLGNRKARDAGNAQLSFSDPANVVTVVATKPVIAEDGSEPGLFTITRSGGGSQALMIGYTITGTAKPGLDHTRSNGWISLAAGVNSATVSVTPRPDTVVESGEACTLTLTWVLRMDAGGPTSILPGSPNRATVIINNTAVPSGSGLLGEYFDTASTTYTNPANFDPAQLKLTRVDPTVNFDWLFGTPNGIANLTSPDNYSVAWEANLAPPASGSYSFQLDADDRARVLLDLNDGNGLQQVLENGWDTPALGTFKASAAFNLNAPATPADRYRIRVEFVETTNNATCRFQWRAGSSAYSNLASAVVFTDKVNATNGWVGSYYANTNFSGAPVRVQVDSAVTSGNNGIWGTGTPDPAIAPDTFSVRWTGQVQPQYTEEYTFVVNADDSVKLWLNGQPQTLLMASAANNAGTYSYNSGTGQAVITHPSIPAGSFSVGEIVRVDPTSGNLSALAYSNYTVLAVNSNTFTIAVPGAFSTGTGNCNIEWLNKPIDWPSSTTVDRYTRVAMVGGARYDIRLEYFENTGSAKCQLSWYSPSQPKQIIPSERLYPANGSGTNAPAPPAYTGETDATALVGAPFTYTITANNGATVSVSRNPSWLTFNGTSLSGTPPLGSAGTYQILITMTTAAGTGSSVLNLRVLDTGRSIVREFWTGVPGTNVSAIPVSSPASGSNTLTSLEAATNFGDNYGARIRGFLTPPVSGNYYFWIAANNAAELWISNDEEPVNAFKRAWVTSGTGVRQWNKPGETGQKSPWLALEAGKRYYMEILHKAGTGAGDNLAVGWLKPGQSGSAPSEVVPGYALSPYVPAGTGSNSGTLYLATMLAQSGADTDGVGTSTLRLSDDETYATMRYSYSGLSGPITAQHIHSDPYLSHPSTILFDIDTPETPGDGLQPDGSYKWTLTPRGTLSVADIREIIKQGKTYINLHTALYPNGEIRGNYTLAKGSRTFTPPPAPPAWTDDHATPEGAARFLAQATFGANVADITNLMAMPSYEAWIDDQFTKPGTFQLAEVLTNELSDANGGAQFDETLTFNAWWRNSMTGQDQLRQRVAFALSQIHVVSADGPLDNNARALSHFYDTLVTNAFGNFRDILEATTLAPAMGRYLDMLRNDKPDQSVGRIPNENYAREIKQLFSIGLYRMWPDGSLILDSKDQPIDTYSQREIIGFSHVFTGWDYGYDGPYRTALNAPADWTRPMREVPARHFTGPKRVLNNEVLPGLPSLGGVPLDPYATHTSAQYDHPSYQALPAQELAAAHDQLFNHPNVGPFICRQLIQRLVTSHPSRDYLYRVVQKFNDNGAGVRGDMKAVIKAILLDYEARSGAAAAQNYFGKQREPLLRVTAAARAFRTEGFSGTYVQTSTSTNKIRVDTTTPHRLATGNNVYLEFTDASAPAQPRPTAGIYSVTVVDADTFTVNATGWITGTYSQAAGSSTVLISIGSHWLENGHKAFIDFTSGGADGVAGLDRAVHVVAGSSTTDSSSGGTFTITAPGAPPSTARSGNVMIPRFTGSFTVSNSGLPAPNEKRITLDTTFGSNIADHHLSVGDAVYLNFTRGNPQPTDAEFVVESVPDPNTFTVLTSSAIAPGTDGDNGMFMFPLVAQPQARNGTVNARPSTFNMGYTDADLAQSPLNSPTVFNFFLPDYKFPGPLAAQGLTTPEFQLTAETTVIRQGNFLYNGLFNPGNTNGVSSFKSGSHALLLDFAPWMGNATNAGLGAGADVTKPWTDDVNLGSLVDKLAVLLTGGPMSASSKQIITNLVFQRTISAISTGNPCTVTTAAPHGLTSSNLVFISGVTGGSFSPSITATTGYTNTVTSPTTFTVPVNCTSISGLNLSNARVGYMAYTNGGTASDTQKRDRIRSVVHLILVSPDFTIQK